MCTCATNVSVFEKFMISMYMHVHVHVSKTPSPLFYSSSGLSCVALLPAVDALLALHTSHTERARLTIEKAILSRGRGQATILLEEAMGILEHVGEARAYEQLAIAHLWKAICVGEQIIG